MFVSELLEQTLKTFYNSFDRTPKKATYNSDKPFILVEVFAK